MSYDEPTVTRQLLTVALVNTTRSTGRTVSDAGDRPVATIRIW